MQHMSHMIIFDDGRGQLGPMTDLRASFEVRTGMFTTAARIAAHRPKTLGGYWVPDRLRPVVAARANAPVNVLSDDDETLYCVNGRWAVPDHELTLDVGTALVEESTGHVVIAHLRHADAEYFLATRELHERVSVRHSERRLLYKYPWDVIAVLGQTIPHDIYSTRIAQARIPGPGMHVLGDRPVELHPTSLIGPNVVFDAQEGPIVVHEDATVRPNVVLCGPCSIGPGSTVVDGSLIRPNTVVGPVCKVAGEIGGTVFQGYSNKAHDGFLGDSWIGKWVNFGAGTTNSNLLNSMRLEPDSPRHRTGLKFLGAIIGDHVKTAIGTRLMTGTALGTGAMISMSTPPPTCVRRFAWLTDDGERVYRLEKFAEAMRAMMGRRGKAPAPEYLELVGALHAGWTGAGSGVSATG
jgi:UDP-N-acetylglucosamine diphosphorylase/glucosamine-1-phosphate N-acetyltransferase